MKTIQTEKLDVLLEHYRRAADVKISHRAHVVILHLKHWCVRDIAEATLKPESTVSRWISAFKKHGLGSIFPGHYQNQNAAKLTREQKLEVKAILEARLIPDSFFAVGHLKTYFSARFDVEYRSPQSYYGILALCDYSYKLPSLFNIRRDDALVETRIREIRHEIQPYLSNPHYLVLTADETRIQWSTLKRRAWLKKGQRIVIKEKREHRYQNYLGFLDLKTGQDWLFRLGWQNQEQIIPVLLKLTQAHPHQQIVVIWDNARFHRGQLLRSQLGSGNPLANLHLVWLPPYAPDTNPQEHVWRYAKDQIANQVFNQFEQLLATFEASITGRTFTYKF